MENNSKGKNYFLPISILIAALLVASALIYSAGIKNTDVKKQEANVQQAVQKTAGSKIPVIDDDVVLGNPGAPITIFIFSDYQCPACGFFYQEVELLLRENYVETGKAKMVYKNFPLENIHPFARLAAEAAECARDQGKYWIYHDALFEKQEQLSQIDFADLAETLGLDKTQFSECYNNQKYKDEVTADFEEGLALGVDATPTIFINSQKIRGVYPYETLSLIIDEALGQ